MELACIPFQSGTVQESTSSLGLFDAPYTFDVQGLEMVIQRGTEVGSLAKLNTLLCELNGQQFELMVEAGYARMKRWTIDKAEEHINLTKNLNNEVQERLRAWAAAREISLDIGHGGYPEDKIARDVYLHWGAKHICCLVTELLILEKGVEHLQDRYNLAKLPWQCMNMC